MGEGEREGGGGGDPQDSFKLLQVKAGQLACKQLSITTSFLPQSYNVTEHAQLAKLVTYRRFINRKTNRNLKKWYFHFAKGRQYQGWWMVLWKMRSLGKFYPTLEISHNLLMGLGVLRFCVCRSNICFSIKSLSFSVSRGLGFENNSLGVSASLGFTVRHP